MSSVINGFIIFSLVIVLVYFVGLLTFISDHEENKCDMTYMFEYPQFVRISNRIDEYFPKYGLYAYSEGRWTERTRNMFFDGIPVLFIPGNAGSHRQVRSLASIALRKAVNSRSPFHFDYFSIDLNEELSGLNGALLTEQLQYVNASLFRVLELYKKRPIPPKSIILFGHSMGGVLARKLVTSLSPSSGLVPILLTLASPHKRPPLLLDSYLYDFYKNLDTTDGSNNTTMISVTGGYSDFIVPSFLSELPETNHLHVISTHIPRSWLPADHLCILWCKQTILAINRALFDCVDAKTKQISTDPEHRKAAFHHHLVKHSGTAVEKLANYDTITQFRTNGEWIEPMARQYTIDLPRGVKETHFYMIRLLDHIQHEALTVVGNNVKTVHWAFVCGAHFPKHNLRVCEDFTHLTQFSEIWPSGKNKRRLLSVNLHELMRNHSDVTHVVLKLLPTDAPVSLNVDVYNSNGRKKVVSLPNLVSLRKQYIIEETDEKIVHFELELINLGHVMQSYQLFVDSSKCSSDVRQATASLIVPWGHQNVHKHFTESDSKPLHIRLYSSKPSSSDQSAKIRLVLDPNCRYHISIRPSILGTLGQIARFYSPHLVVNVAAVVLMSLNAQLKRLDSDRYCSIFFVAVKEGAKPYYILTGVKLISRVLSAKPLTNFMPAPDWLIMSQEGSDFFLLPLLSYICSVGIVWMMGVILCISMVVFETTVHRVALKFLARTVSFTVSWSDYVMSALHKVPFVVAGALLALSVTTTGSLALCLGLVFYFLRLTQLSQDYIEGLVWFYMKKLGKKLKKGKTKEEIEDRDKKETKGTDGETKNTLPIHDTIFFHATIFLIWCIITLINLPSVLTWAHNFKYSTVLKPDPSFVPGFALSLCALPLWQLELPIIERRWYREVGQLMSVLAVLSLIYAPISIFRLNYTLTAAIVIVTIHQVLGVNRQETVQEPESNDGSSAYDAIKTKME